MTNGKKIGMILKNITLVYFLYTILSIPVLFFHGLISVLSGLDLTLTETIANPDMPLAHFTMIADSAIFILATYIVAKRYKRPRTWSYNWDKQEAINQGLIGCLWGIATIGISFLVIWLVGGIKVEAIGWEQSLLFIPSWIIMWAGVAISEEYVCRGYFHGLLKEYFGLLPAILVGSLLFALMHSFNDNIFESPIPLLNLFLAGVLFAVAKEVSGSLWLPTGMHFTWNLFQGNVFGFGVSGITMESTLIKIVPQGSKYISGGLFGAEGSIITVFVQILAIIVIWHWHSKRTTSLTETEVL